MSPMNQGRFLDLCFLLSRVFPRRVRNDKLKSVLTTKTLSMQGMIHVREAND